MVDFELLVFVLAMIMALQKLESDQNYIQDLVKASEMIDKVSCEAKIRSLMDRLLLKNSAEMYVYGSISLTVSNS